MVNEIRIALINGRNKNYDHDLSKILESVSNPGIISGCLVEENKVNVGKGFCEVTRGTGLTAKTFYAYFEIQSDVSIDTSGTKKVWLEFNQANIDDGSINTPDGLGVAIINTGVSYPTKNFVKLASIVSGAITDEREMMDNIQAVKEALESAIATHEGRLDGLDTRVDDIEASLLPPSALVSSDYLAGEDLIERDSLFLENQNQSFVEGILINDAHTASFASTVSTATAFGVRCLAKKNINISTVIKSGTCSATGCYIRDGAGVVIASVSFAGNIATFNMFLPANFPFSVEAHSGGSNYTAHYYNGALPAHTGVNVQFTSGSSSGSSGGNAYNILSINTEETVDSLKIGNINNNKRIALRIVGSNVSDTVIKLALSKKGTPPANLNLRLESDLAGVPSGSLIDLDGTISIPQTQLTNTPFKYKTIASNITDTHAYSMTNIVSTVNSSGFRLYAKKKLVIKSVQKDPNSTATTAYLKTDAGVLLASVSFVGNTATFPTKNIIEGLTYFRIEADKGGVSYSQQWNNTPGGFPANKTNVNYVSGSLNGVDSNYYYNFVNIITDEIEDTVFDGSVIVPRGAIGWLVGYMGTYGSETVDANNYYQIGIVDKHTTCNIPKYRDGTNYLTSKNDTAVNDTITPVTYQGTTTASSISIYPREDILLKTLTLTNAATLTIVGEGVNFSGAFVAGVATINVILKKLKNYNINITGSGLQYHQGFTATLNNLYIHSIGNNLNFIFNSEAINNPSNAFPYVQSNIFEQMLLSKTDAKYSYKIGFRGFANESKLTGEVTTIVIGGVKKGFSGKTIDATQYLSNTPGALSESAGTNSRKVGKSYTPTEVQIVDVPL